MYMYNVSESRSVLYFNVMCKNKKEQTTKDNVREKEKKERKKQEYHERHTGT